MTPAAPDFDWHTFDFDRDTPKTNQTGAINDAIGTDLSSFQARGGKLIVVTGVSDPVFSAKDQVAWFRQMQQDTKNAADFSRLFMIPGMNHCGGGQAFNDFDPLTALENWHDNNQAPQALAENMASEHSARVVAMKAASDNAKKIINELQLSYNKTRFCSTSPLWTSLLMP